MDTRLSQLVAVSRRLGKDPLLVWKGAGNISIKTADGRAMFIKASGTQLGKMTVHTGWRQVDVAKTRRLLKRLLQTAMQLAQKWQVVTAGLARVCCDGLVGRGMPSIETFFHSLLGPCVIHLHPVILIPFLCSRDGRKILQAQLARMIPFAFLPFRGLGAITAGQILNLQNKHPFSKSSPCIYMLGNHGVIVSGRTMDEAQAVMQTILETCRRLLDEVKPIHLKAAHDNDAAAAIEQALADIGHPAEVIRIPDSDLLTVGGQYPSPDWFEGVMTPEELVYLGGPPVWINRPCRQQIADAVRAAMHTRFVLPRGFWVAGKGLYTTAPQNEAALYCKVQSWYVWARSQGRAMGGIMPLPKKYLRNLGV